MTVTAEEIRDELDALAASLLGAPYAEVRATIKDGVWTVVGTAISHYSPSSSGAGTPASTVVSETNFGQAAAVGSSTDYARADHTHGTPAMPSAADVGADSVGAAAAAYAAAAADLAAHEGAANPHGTSAADVGADVVGAAAAAYAAAAADLAAHTALTNPHGTTASDVGAQPADADLTALAGLSGTGLVSRTASETYSVRTIAGTANQVSVANGDGVSGNPTLSLPQDIHTGATPTFAGATLSGSGSALNVSAGYTLWHTGVGPPTFTTRSAGTRDVWYPELSPTNGDYAAGVEAAHIWFAVPQSTHLRGWKWYGGTTEIGKLTSEGAWHLQGLSALGANPGAGFGAFWVGNSTPTVPKFTDDAGASFTLAYTTSPAMYVRETSGPTTLTVGAIADGEFLVRSGATLVGTSASSSVAVEDGGVAVGSFTTIDFIGGTITDAGSGRVTVEYTGGSGSAANLTGAYDIEKTGSPTYTDLGMSSEFTAGTLPLHIAAVNLSSGTIDPLTSPATGVYDLGTHSGTCLIQPPNSGAAAGLRWDDMLADGEALVISVSTGIGVGTVGGDGCRIGISLNAHDTDFYNGGSSHLLYWDGGDGMTMQVLGTFTASGSVVQAVNPGARMYFVLIRDGDIVYLGFMQDGTGICLCGYFNVASAGWNNIWLWCNGQSGAGTQPVFAVHWARHKAFSGAFYSWGT